MKTFQLSDADVNDTVAFITQYLEAQRASFGGENSSLRSVLNALLVPVVQVVDVPAAV